MIDLPSMLPCCSFHGGSFKPPAGLAVTRAVAGCAQTSGHALFVSCAWRVPCMSFTSLATLVGNEFSIWLPCRYAHGEKSGAAFRSQARAERVSESGRKRDPMRGSFGLMKAAFCGTRTTALSARQRSARDSAQRASIRRYNCELCRLGTEATQQSGWLPAAASSGAKRSGRARSD